jgi:hypothetical protein
MAVEVFWLREEKKRREDDSRKGAAEYMAELRENIRNLTISFAQYDNFVRLIANKYGVGDLSKMEESERLQMIEICNQIRVYCHVIHIQVVSITQGTRAPMQVERSELETKLRKVLEKYVIEIESLREYVMAVNKVLTTDIIRRLMQSSEDILNAVYE